MSQDSPRRFLRCLGELHRAVHAIGLYLEAQTEGALSQPEALIVALIAERSEATINELHQAFLHRRSTLTSLLDRLESKGFVRRSTAMHDRRSVTIRLTARGTRLAATIAHAFDRLHEELGIAVSDRDVALVCRIAEAASRLSTGA